MTEAGKARPIRVLVVDDSAFMRIALTRIIQSDPQLEVIGCAHDGHQALAMAADLNPDVVTMDVEMPRMNGLEALRRIMNSMPRPVIMVSSLTQEGAQMTFDALELGAFDYIPKQLGSRSLDVAQIRRELVGMVKAAAANRARLPVIHPGWNAALERPETKRAENLPSPSVICIGCSTGGPRALQHILPALPANLPAGIVVVQHMPIGFTAPFAERLNGLCRLKVKEAEQDDWIEPGVVLIAPAGWHTTIYRRTHARYSIRLAKTPSDSLHMPSVDVMMLSAAESLRNKAMGVILTGMGSDGEAGMRAIEEAGGHTVGQDEATCAVYGMPRACAAAGTLAKVLPLSEISDEIMTVTACYA